MSTAQRRAVRDGHVTDDEYEAGYRRFTACMSRAGYPIAEQPRAGHIRHYLIAERAVDLGIDETCLDRHFWKIEELYQLQHSDESETHLILVACARGLGISTTTVSDQELKQLIEATGVEFQDCVDEYTATTSTPAPPIMPSVPG
ncbi:MAG: hypothetical protein U0Q22_16095 [Acidimicrobiales bacterium]